MTQTYCPEKNQKSQYTAMRRHQSARATTRNLEYNQAIVVPRDCQAVCIRTTASFSQLRITNLDPTGRATFIVVSESECDGTYTLSANMPDRIWTSTTNFNQRQLTVYNLSPGAASIEVMLVDTPVEY
ncbi:MAG TPA: hypothetical protein ENJ82_13250 [Bacteroidetes bacterium]|nr:hypothetical protein [Bacteroidota bacterium]